MLVHKVSYQRKDWVYIPIVNCLHLSILKIRNSDPVFSRRCVKACVCVWLCECVRVCVYVVIGIINNNKSLICVGCLSLFSFQIITKYKPIFEQVGLEMNQDCIYIYLPKQVRSGANLYLGFL